MNIKTQKFFLFLALFAPVALVLGKAVADITVILVGVGFLIHSAMTRNFSWLRIGWVKAATILWLYLILCGALSLYDAEAGLIRGLTWVRFPIFAAAFATWLLPLDTEYKWLRRSLMITLLCVVVDTLVQYVAGKSLSGYVPAEYAHRLSGPFGHYLVVGVYLARLGWPLIGMAFARALEHGRNYKKLVLPLALIAVLALTILLSGERMAFMLFALSAFVFWIGAKGLRWLLFAAGAGGAAIVLAFVLMSPQIHERSVTTTLPILEDFKNSSYGVIFQNGFTAWKIAPWTGVGPKNYQIACLANGPVAGFKLASPWEIGFNCASHPHNLYIEWLAETGLIGLGLFLIFLGCCGREIARNLRQTDLPDYYIVWGFAVGLVPFLWPLMATMSFFINWSAVSFWWVLALSLKPRKVIS